MEASVRSVDYDAISCRSGPVGGGHCRTFGLLHRGTPRRGHQWRTALCLVQVRLLPRRQGPGRVGAGAGGKLRSSLFSGRHGGGYVEPRHENVASRGRGEDRKTADHRRAGGGFVRLPFRGSDRRNPEGTAARGQQVFEAKLCASCHEQVDTGAPNLAIKAGQFSAFSMVSALWQHGAGMLARMVVQNKEWQVLSAQEMADIIAYLNTKK